MMSLSIQLLPGEREREAAALARLERDRKPGELESGMLTGSGDGEISATERFAGELTEEEALEALNPNLQG
jgi:hypothetical protein